MSRNLLSSIGVQLILTVSARNCRAILESRTGVFVWTTTLFASRFVSTSWESRVPRFFFLFSLALFLCACVSIKNILVPDMTVRSVFLFGVDREEGRRNGVAKFGFFFAHSKSAYKRGGIYLLGRKGFRLPAKKSRPAKLMI